MLPNDVEGLGMKFAKPTMRLRPTTSYSIGSLNSSLIQSRTPIGDDRLRYSYQIPASQQPVYRSWGVLLSTVLSVGFAGALGTLEIRAASWVPI